MAALAAPLQHTPLRTLARLLAAALPARVMSTPSNRAARLVMAISCRSSSCDGAGDLHRLGLAQVLLRIE